MHAGRRTIDMKNIKQGFSLKAWVQSPGVDLGGWAKAKIEHFSEYCHVAYRIKADDACSNMVANIFAQRHTLDPGVGWSNHFFLKIRKLRGIEHRAP